MEIKHKYESIDGIKTLVIYVNYPDDIEFGIDFKDYKNKIKNTVKSIKDYIVSNLNDISDNTALLILNGIVVGTVALGSMNIPNEVPINEIRPTEQIEESIGPTSDKKIVAETSSTEDTSTDTNFDENIEENQNNEIAKETKDETANNNQNNINNNQNTNQNQNQNQKPTPNNNNNNNNNSNGSGSGNVSTPTYNGQIINVKLASGQVIQIGLEDYVTNVVCSEMPALFEVEALKAQSVAARTYALKRIGNGGTLSATVSDQVYKTEAQLRAMWQGSYDVYFNKVKSAVEKTRGQTIKYNGAYIDALYFSTSNGKTEDAVNVWGNSIPYLKSVTCNFDIGTKFYKKDKVISKADVSKKLGVAVNSASDFNIITRTEGNRVKDVNVSGKTFTGVKIRSLLGLNSADFEVLDSGSNLIFSTRGYGHGVGMSQYGANEMAKQGYSYIDILKYFYTGVTISG